MAEQLEYEFDVFLSHHHSDKPWVNRLKKALEQADLNVWFDKEQIDAGQRLMQGVARGLKQSRVVVVVVSPAAVKSKWVMDEYATAYNTDRTLIAAVLQDAEIPFQNTRKWVDFRDDSQFEEKVDELIQGIKPASADQPKPTEPESQRTSRDPILEMRLDDLEQHLECVADSNKWLRSKLEPEHFAIGRELWNNFCEALDQWLGKDAREQRVKLKRIREILDAEKVDGDEEAELQKAWYDYSDIYEQSQSIHGSYLEFIGGLAIRDKGLDEQICELADEVVQSCAYDSTGGQFTSLTVPARDEALTLPLAQTLTQAVRLRFPEWTIWVLPFMAQSFAELMWREREEFKEFAKDMLPQAGNGASDPQHAEEQVHVLLADAFATYSMGPAYACAAILLRFDPSTANQEDIDCPAADVKRAAVVLGTLERMDQRANNNPYDTDVIQPLAEQWGKMLQRAKPGNGLSTENQAFLAKLVDGAVDRLFYSSLRASAQYCATDQSSGWNAARKWADAWGACLQDGQPLTAEASAESKLRDALNAAWLCRLRHPKEVKLIADAAYQLCSAIIIKKREAADSASDRKDSGASRSPKSRPSKKKPYTLR